MPILLCITTQEVETKAGNKGFLHRIYNGRKRTHSFILNEIVPAEFVNDFRTHPDTLIVIGTTPRTLANGKDLSEIGEGDL